MNKIPCTKEELSLIEQERNRLVSTERPEIIKAISSARDLGDLSENAEYHAAREKQSFIEGRIQELNNFLASCEVIDPTAIVSDQVQFGATVTLVDLDNNQNKIYKIVGEYLSNPNNGLLSYNSPLSKELMGKKTGDIVDITNAKGVKSLEITKIEYK
ncbi:transcription elongation factor GreA [Rickettsiales bacterium LUAb2]